MNKVIKTLFKEKKQNPTYSIVLYIGGNPDFNDILLGYDEYTNLNQEEMNHALKKITRKIETRKVERMNNNFLFNWGMVSEVEAIKD